MKKIILLFFIFLSFSFWASKDYSNYEETLKKEGERIEEYYVLQNYMIIGNPYREKTGKILYDIYKELYSLTNDTYYRFKMNRYDLNHEENYEMTELGRADESYNCFNKPSEDFKKKNRIKFFHKNNNY